MAKLAFDDIQKLPTKDVGMTMRNEHHWLCRALGSYVSELVQYLFGVFTLFYDGRCWETELNWAACTDFEISGIPGSRRMDGWMGGRRAGGKQLVGMMDDSSFKRRDNRRRH